MAAIYIGTLALELLELFLGTLLLKPYSPGASPPTYASIRSFSRARPKPAPDFYLFNSGDWVSASAMDSVSRSRYSRATQRQSIGGDSGSGVAAGLRVAKCRNPAFPGDNYPLAADFGELADIWLFPNQSLADGTALATPTAAAPRIQPPQ